MQFPTPRYLVAFHPKRVPHYFADVLIIGGGLAGVRAALGTDPRLSVLIITKDGLQDSNSSHAQGGIAGVVDPEDRFEDHVADTLAAGGSLCDPAVVRQVIYEAPRRIEGIDRLGHPLRHGRGTPRPGARGWSRPRSHRPRAGRRHRQGGHAGRDRSPPSPGTRQGLGKDLTTDLLTLDGVCRGAITWNPKHGKTLVWAKQTILASGGAGQVYRESTNPPVATGDGLAMAYRAGAELRDMEFVQFHPTVLYIAGGSRSLISEATRGEGAHLVDRNGHRFMPDYDPRAELAPRDVVSLSIVSQMEKTRHPNVYLDMTHLDPQRVMSRFPGIAAICAEFDLDITRDHIPVRPGAHYIMGGITVDLEGRTTLPGLWAAGEVASSGLHGANRLASNSLLEALVYGAHVSEGASCAALGQKDAFSALPIENPRVDSIGEPLNLDDIRNALKSLLWRNVGVRRDGDALAEARQTVKQWCRYVLARQFNDPGGWELQNMISIARLMIEAALEREESRGAHVRTDYPQADEARWNRHICFQRELAVGD